MTGPSKVSVASPRRVFARPPIRHVQVYGLLPGHTRALVLLGPPLTPDEAIVMPGSWCSLIGD